MIPLFPFLPTKVKEFDSIYDDVEDKNKKDVSKSGCIFYDHLETYRELNTSKAFQRWVYT